MEHLPGNWFALLAVVFLLGLRHGMDPDHLATIDGLTRFNAVSHPRLSRWAGFLFSCGHGAVVMVVAVMVGLLAARWTAPHWLNAFGAWISIAFLLALGAINLAAVLRARPDEVVYAVGLKGRWLGRLNRASHPGLVVVIGALFALSFDTVSQTALFSLAASSIAGWLYSALLGLVFTVGMMVTDGLNGLWVARLIRRADRRARIASRVLGLSIAGLSLLVAGLGVIRWFSPSVDHWSDPLGLSFGIGVVTVVLLSYLLALRLSADTAPAPATADYE
ncbi:MAG: nickel transporter [Gammaproteobacteria bacterium]